MSRVELQGSEARRLASAAALRTLADRLEGGAMGSAAPELQERLAGVVRAVVDVTAELVRGSRHCPVCGAELVRKPYETPRTFAKRRACDQRCAGVMRQRTIAAKVQAAGQLAESKPCAQCGRSFARRTGQAGYETPREFAVRRFCCRSCSTAWRHAHPAPRKPREPRPVGSPRPSVAAVASASVAPRALPDPRPPRQEVASRVRTLGTPCREHPGEMVGVYGCPACNASAKRRAAERSRPFTPQMGGRRAQAE